MGCCTALTSRAIATIALLTLCSIGRAEPEGIEGTDRESPGLLPIGSLPSHLRDASAIGRIVLCDGAVGIAGSIRPLTGDVVVTNSNTISRLHHALTTESVASRPARVGDRLCHLVMISHKGDVLAIVAVSAWHCQLFVYGEGRRTDQGFVTVSGPEQPLSVKNTPFVRIVYGLLKRRAPAVVRNHNAFYSAMYGLTSENVLFGPIPPESARRHVLNRDVSKRLIDARAASGGLEEIKVDRDRDGRVDLAFWCASAGYLEKISEEEFFDARTLSLPEIDDVTTVLFEIPRGGANVIAYLADARGEIELLYQVLRLASAVAMPKAETYFGACEKSAVQEVTRKQDLPDLNSLPRLRFATRLAYVLDAYELPGANEFFLEKVGVVKNETLTNLLKKRKWKTALTPEQIIEKWGAVLPESN